MEVNIPPNRANKKKAPAAKIISLAAGHVTLTVNINVGVFIDHYGCFDVSL